MHPGQIGGSGPPGRSDDAVAGTLRKMLEFLRKSNDPFVALDLERSADDREVRAAFLSKTKQYHPSRFGRRPDEVVKLANEVFLLVKDAYLQTKDSEGRQRVLAKLEPTALPRRSAAPRISAVQSARSVSHPTSPRRPSRDSAAARGQPGADGVPVASVGGKQDISAGHASASRERAARKQTFDAAVILCKQGAFQEARKALQKLAVDDPNEAQYRKYMHYAWGMEHQDDKRFDEAAAEFRRALRVDPQFAPAKQANAELPGRRGRSASLFSKLFGK